jgi:hypothetical protein
LHMVRTHALAALPATHSCGIFAGYPMLTHKDTSLSCSSHVSCRALTFLPLQATAAFVIQRQCEREAMNTLRRKPRTIPCEKRFGDGSPSQLQKRGQNVCLFRWTQHLVRESASPHIANL